jgi:hypothetical protein
MRGPSENVVMHPVAAAIVFSMLLMGALGFFVVVPIVCIDWTWNAVVAHFSLLPRIQIWQAGLLYAAAACIAYLMGWVQIEFKQETLD